MNDRNFNHEINEVIEKMKDINRQLKYVNTLVEFYENNCKSMSSETTERFAQLVKNEFQCVSKMFENENT